MSRSDIIDLTDDQDLISNATERYKRLGDSIEEVPAAKRVSTKLSAISDETEHRVSISFSYKGSLDKNAIIHHIIENVVTGGDTTAFANDMRVNSSIDKELELEQKKICDAVELGIEYGDFDGSHHKMWTIDQMLQILMGKTEYAEFYAACRDEWDQGIGP